MSTSKAIREKWATAIFEHEDILLITEQVWPQDVFGNQQVGCDLEKAMYNGCINFIQYMVQRYSAPTEIGGCGSYQYQVEVRYYREQIDTEETENIIQDFFETLDSLVSSELGSTWGNLVSGYSRENGFPNIQKVGFINDRPVVGGIYKYFAEK